MLIINDYKKAYGNHLVLGLQELMIPDGLTWFRGVNGSGKSTFFKSIAGITPFEGSISTSNGLDFKADALAFRRMISYAAAEPQFPIYLTGNELLSFYAKTRGGVLQEELMQLFEVDAYVNQKLETYSSGMLKKISLIAAFMGDSEILALDEPFTTIDSASQEILANLIVKTLANGKSVMIASHHEMPFLENKVAASFLVDNQTIKQL